MSNDRINFGDHKATEKVKETFEQSGDEYGVKTHAEVTRLEKNGRMIFESVPGATVTGFVLSERLVTFAAQGLGDTQITLELLPEAEYRLCIDGVNIGMFVKEDPDMVRKNAEAIFSLPQ